MYSPKISVIVPVYNAEKYLHRCIDSILAQTFTDFELLLIDDGSTDKSGDICDEYAKKDKRIRVFHKENGGISVTREFGINNVNGIFVQFVDSDDWIDKNMLEIMYKRAVLDKADIVSCNFVQEFVDKSIITKISSNSADDYIRSVISNDWGVLWKMLIRYQLFIENDIHFPKGVDGGEDYYVTICLLLNSVIIRFEDFYPYHYNRYNMDSFIATPSLKKLMFQIQSTYLVEDLLKRKKLINTYKKELDKRKCLTKLPILYRYFLYGIKLYPELSIRSTFLVSGIKNRLLLISSILLCKVNL